MQGSIFLARFASFSSADPIIGSKSEDDSIPIENSEPMRVSPGDVCRCSEFKATHRGTLDQDIPTL